MLQSARLIGQLITAEVDSGTDPGRIVLGGFSQGATMSLLTGLTGERKLAGIAVLSGWLPLRNKFKAVSRTDLRICLSVLWLIGTCRCPHHTPHRSLFSGVTAQMIHLLNTNSVGTRLIS
jgi:poly(3-hydroxybutyrate) depolymerase